MLFRGESRCFPCARGEQYEAIGAFWEEMSARFPDRPLIGLGWRWQDGRIDYAIGFEGWQDAPFALLLPREGWKEYEGRTQELAALYGTIYGDGPLTCELEEFFPDGSCRIRICREPLP